MSIVPSIEVIFYLSGDEFNLKEVTKRLDLIPTETRTKDSFPPQGLACTLWALGIKHYNCNGIYVLFEELIDILENKTEIIRGICKDYSIETSFEVIIHMKDGDSPEVVLPRKIISFAAAINAEIGFDIYCYE